MLRLINADLLSGKLDDNTFYYTIVAGKEIIINGRVITSFSPFDVSDSLKKIFEMNMIGKTSTSEFLIDLYKRQLTEPGALAGFSLIKRMLKHGLSIVFVYSGSDISLVNCLIRRLKEEGIECEHA